MTGETPPDWVLIEAAKRCGIRWSGTDDLRKLYADKECYRAYSALCDMIQKYEQPPVDRKLLCAREATKEWAETKTMGAEEIAIRAIELWESGYGND